MAYKLIAIDIDDTLLTENGEIPQRARESIKKAKDKGVHVVLSTGRTRKGMQRFYDQLELDTLMITAGGAEVYDADQQRLFECGVDPAIVKELLRYAFGKGLHPQVYIDGELVYRDRNKYAKLYEVPYGHLGIEMPDLMEQETIITPKVLYVMDEHKVESIKKETEELFPMLTIKRSKPMFLEFAHPSVSKGKALEFVANHYGVSSDEVIAVGDTDIDIPMIEFAGLGVAVENGYQHVKDAADIVCASNQDAGVADVIEKYLLEA